MEKARFAPALLALLPLSALATGPRPASSATAASAYILPAAANNPGLYGATFRTRLSVFNPNGAPLSLVFDLLTPNGAGGEYRTTLATGKTLSFDNALQNLFGYSGGGAIVIAIDPGQPNLGDQFVVSSEVYADGPSGRYSTVVPPMSDADPVASVTDPYGGASFAPGILVDGTTRANVGCANADPNVPASVTVDVYDGTPAKVWSTTLPVPARGWNQVAVPVSVARGFVSFRADVLLAYCYAVNVDNASNDGTLLPATYTVVRPY